MAQSTLLDNCNPRLIQVDQSCGCTLTRANILAMTDEIFESQGLLEVGMDKLIAGTKELRMTGVKQKALMDLLLSRMTRGRASILGTDQNNKSVIAPFTLVPQRHRVNSNYWLVESGNVHPQAGIGAIPASAWQLVLLNDPGTFATPLVDLYNYFMPGTYIVVLTQDPITQVGRTIQFKVLSSVDGSGGGVEKALVSVQPNVTDVWWAANPGDQAEYQPETGVVINLSNSVSNYESWCYQHPAENTLKLRDFWWQTIRNTWCYNDEYLKALTAPLTSDYFKKFRTLPLADQRRRAGEQEERDYFNTVFYGQRIDENQTPSSYQDLPRVVDPNDTECLMEYKANTIGIRTQLDECGRVIDFQNAVIDFDVLAPLFYQLSRTRDSEEIDIMTDRLTYAAVIWMAIQYYKARYGFEMTKFLQQGQAIKFGDVVLWNYTRMDFPEAGFAINLIRDTYFDDHLAAFPDAIKSRGRALWVIDWSDIGIGLMDARSVNRQTNVADDLYNCVIQPNVNHYQLKSKKVQVQVGDANRHLIIENYSAACPTINSTPCVEAT
jgi:hypothetical protein